MMLWTPGCCLKKDYFSVDFFFFFKEQFWIQSEIKQKVTESFPCSYVLPSPRHIAPSPTTVVHIPHQMVPLLQLMNPL